MSILPIIVYIEGKIKMNNNRRANIQQIISKICKLQSEIESIFEEIENVRDEEVECFENIPENFQLSERYDISASAVENLESACDSFEVVKNSLDDVVSSLEEASV